MFLSVRSAWRTGACVALLVAMFATFLSRPARATFQFGERLQLSGNVETQNLVRMPEWRQVEFIQQRNTARIRIDWDWLQDGKFMDKFDLPFIKESKFYLLYRFAYDGFYDLAPGGRQTGQEREDDIIGGPVVGNRIGSIRGGCELTSDLAYSTTCLRDGPYSRFTAKNRGRLKLENRLREIYADFTLQDIPLSLRIGRQQVIWGEADQFRLMDIWNPVDVSWRFPMADTFDDFRVPLWLIKGMWDFGTVGPFSNTFLEFVYNPFDFQPGQKVGWLPRPDSLPMADPLRAGQVSDLVLGGGHIYATPVFNLNGTSYQKGDFKRNPQDASEVGLRLHTVTPQGFETSINYIYGRGKFVGNSPAFGGRINQVVVERVPRDYSAVQRFVPLNSTAALPVSASYVDATMVHPYVHVFGVTGNYFDADLTNAVLRMEMAYSMGQPYATSQEDKLLDIYQFTGKAGDFEHVAPYTGQTPVGFTKRDVFAGMLGFDRPSWIRWLNSKGTFFISSQLFWVNIPGHNVRELRGFSSASDDPYFTPEKPKRISNDIDRSVQALHDSQGFGTWSTHSVSGETGAIIPNPYAGQVERIQDGLKPPADHYNPWEFMTTFTVATFYRGGTLAPQLVTLFDPCNLWAMEALELKYFYTNSLIFAIQQRQVFPFKSDMNDPWFVGRFGRRGEVGLRVTYQF